MMEMRHWLRLAQIMLVLVIGECRTASAELAHFKACRRKP